MSDLELRPAESRAPLRRKKGDERVIAGVCSGLGEYLGVDPMWLRLAFVVMSIGGGSGILLYVIAALAITEED